ncbi:MAG: hypothetical protein JNK05_13430 [Myxococcales bacterium]|nr:hypothetical protein [Myxococcales bacterium]
MSWTVFYAWQSDRPGNTNRNLIQKALEDAIAQVRSDGSLTVDPRLDKDTMDVPGAPDIVATIFSKIDQAAVFVADVTLVTKDAEGRPSPNPNVLIELGYALKTLGWERIVLVVNTAFGPPEDLPFDIRQKRAVAYSISEGAEEKSPERKRLQRVLVDAVRLGLTAAEAQKPKPLAPPAPPSPAALLIEAVERQQPVQRAAARRYMADLLRVLDTLRPPTTIDDEALVAALTATRAPVAEFARVAQTLAAYRAEDAAAEVYRGFEQLLVRYDLPQGFSGTYNRTDFDFYKFLGHELLVVLVAAFLREEAWRSINALLRTPLAVRGSRPDRTTDYKDVSKYTMLLDDVRRDRLKTNNTVRLSIHADLLKDWYSNGDLAEVVGWEQFKAADYFLYVRSRIDADGPHSDVWRPWSVLYLRDLPDFVVRAESKQFATQLAEGFGLADMASLGNRIKQATEELQELYRSAFWDRPGRDYRWERIASR